MSNLVRMVRAVGWGTAAGMTGSRPSQLALLQARELLETLPVLLLLLVLCGLDAALYSVFDTIRQHSFLQYSFRSEPPHRPQGPVTGDFSYPFTFTAGRGGTGQNPRRPVQLRTPTSPLALEPPPRPQHSPFPTPPPRGPAGSHKLEVQVEGDSMLARLLRKTVGALNTSSDTGVESSNMREWSGCSGFREEAGICRADRKEWGAGEWRARGPLLGCPSSPLTGLPAPACLPQPVGLDARAYWSTAFPVGLLLCLCLAQAFGYRLRRVIVAFYFPKVGLITPQS